MLVDIDVDTGLPSLERISKIVVPAEFRYMMRIRCSNLVWKGEGDYVENMQDMDDWFEDLSVDDEAVVESGWDANELAEIKAFIKWICKCDELVCTWIAMAVY